MFGSGSLEQKLREGNGKSAKARVLDEQDGIHVRFNGPHHTKGGLGGEDVTRLHYTLRVEPDGEESFEAKIVIRADQMRTSRWRPGQTVLVLYDPQDHGKVAFDFDAMDAVIKASREAKRDHRRQAAAGD